MKLVRSDSAEVINNISTGARATWGSYALAACITSVFVLLVALPIGAIISARAAIWFAAPTVLAWNIFLLWHAKSPRKNWVVAGSAGRLYVLLFQRRVRGWPVVREPNVLILEPSDIASIAVRTIELFLYGPTPKVIEWLD